MSPTVPKTNICNNSISQERNEMHKKNGGFEEYIYSLKVSRSTDMKSRKRSSCTERCQTFDHTEDLSDRAISVLKPVGLRGP